jgi:hypothetical protein
MMKILERIFISIVLLMSLFGCAAGTGGTAGGTTGGGISTSNGSNSGQAGNITINASQYVTSTVHIAGGHYSTPYIIGNSNTEYILDGDITADGKAISIQASKVVVNLNGHTITYNQTTPGGGVVIDNWNLHDIGITNGTITQDPGYDSNAPTTTLTASVNTTQTTITVASAAGFTSGSYIVVKHGCPTNSFNDEVMQITGISGTTFTVSRAQLLTTACASDSSIPSGATVYQTKSEGDVYGNGNNPIEVYPYNVTALQISGTTLNWGGRDVCGINGSVSGSTFEYNTLNDLWGVGTVSNPHTLKNRTAGIDAMSTVKGSSSANTTPTNNTIRYNTLNSARHRGISLGNNDTAYNNTVTTNSMATNANAISVGSGCTIYTNNITARGEHALGIACSSMGTPNSLNNVEIYNNTIDVQTTRLGQEYGDSFSTTTATTGNSAVGFITKWGGGGVKFHDNIIVGHSNSTYLGQYSPTGQAALINAPTRGIQIGLLSGESARYYNNTVTVTDNDGTGIAYGLVVNGDGTSQGADNSGATFQNNTVTSNISNVALGDNYGPAPGWPLFLQNTFIQANSYSSYHTISAGLGGYFVGTGKFVSNVYQNGASQNSLGMNFGSHQTDNTEGLGWHSILFGRLMNATVKDSTGNVLSNIQLTTHNQPSVGDAESVTANIGNGNVLTGTQTVTDTTNYQAVTDSNGNAQIIVYDYELNDIGSNSTTPVTVTFGPHTITLYNQTTSQAMFTTLPDTTSSAWDALTGSGAFTLNGVNGSISLSTP